MINLNPDTVCWLIGKAHEFHAKEEVTISEDQPLSPADDWARQVLADHVEDPTYQELVATIKDLEPDQQIELVALMWLGRGDYDIEQWDEVIREAGQRWTLHTADYVIATPLVADYLREALALHGYDCET